MNRLAAWVRYRVALLIATDPPAVWDGNRYPRTLRGGWRFLREQVAPAEIAAYEREHRR